jgi:hypothetical protein
MKKFICLQSGHMGVTKGATGAPGEQELNKRIWLRLSEILIEKGFMVQLVNANPTKEEIDKDFDLFLALHGDANIYKTGGGCIASGDKTVDKAWQVSAMLRDEIASQYFLHSEIVNHPERVNPNMTKYYMWSQLSDKTPCVIIEMGVVQDAHDKVLLADTQRIASALARGICKAFGVEYDKPEPKPEEKPDTQQSNTSLEAPKPTQPTVEASKELGRVVLCSVVSYLLTEGVISSLANVVFGERLNPILVLQITGVITYVLKSIDKWLHEQGKLSGNLNWLGSKGLTGF